MNIIERIRLPNHVTIVMYEENGIIRMLVNDQIHGIKFAIVVIRGLIGAAEAFLIERNIAGKNEKRSNCGNSRTFFKVGSKFEEYEQKRLYHAWSDLCKILK